MKFVIQPNKSFFKPAPWRLINLPDGTTKCFLIADSTAKYLIIEALKSKDEAQEGDDVAEFGTTNERIKSQGPGFSLRRLHAGQIRHVYAVEFAIDRMQVYVARNLDKVRIFCGLTRVRSVCCDCLGPQFLVPCSDKGVMIFMPLVTDGGNYRRRHLLPSPPAKRPTPQAIRRPAASNVHLGHPGAETQKWIADSEAREE